MTPDPLFFFPSQKHTEALASLTYALIAKRGFVVITGEIGSGKTTVCRTLLQRLDPAAKVAMLTNTILTPKQLLEATCEKYGLPSEKQTKVALLSKLNRFLVEENDAGNTVVLILDEAQNLSVKALEEMRLISNMETDTQKLIQIMLLGQPELRDKLNRPDMEQLRQRISLRYHLRSLNEQETGRYIEHRLTVAGDENRVKFTKGAVDSLYEFSKGVPRLINVVCDQALLTGYLRETRKIDRTIVSEIAAEFTCPPADDESYRETGRTSEKGLGFWRRIKRSGGRPRGEREVVDAVSPQETVERSDDEKDRFRQPEEAELLGKLTQLKLAGISAENGDFMAAIDGVQLREGDHLLGMTVAQVDEHAIVFKSGDKRYQLTIESNGDGEQDSPASLKPVPIAGPGAGPPDV